MLPARQIKDPDLEVIPEPCLLFLGDTTVAGYAKTAFGLRDWAAERCLGELRLDEATVSTGLPPLTPEQAHARGARALVIGVANPGGFIPQAWLPALLHALESGLDIVSGMHARLDAIPALQTAAIRLGRRLIDVRRPPADIPVATGRKRSGQRLLTVGTDCAVGKKYSALALHRAFAQREIDSDFRATGQTGIMIAGSGIPMDAVAADFAAGAAELLSPDAADEHWDIIEGQGSLMHPAYAGVSLSLLHGSQPDAFVLCHQVGREHVLGFPDFPIPSVEQIIELTIRLGRRTNPGIRCAGICLNTAHLGDNEADYLIASECDRLACAVADPMRGGPAFDRLVDECLA